MDKLSGLASKLGGQGESHQQSGSSAGGSGQKEDYLDKGAFCVAYSVMQEKVANDTRPRLYREEVRWQPRRH